MPLFIPFFVAGFVLYILESQEKTSNSPLQEKSENDINEPTEKAEN